MGNDVAVFFLLLVKVAGMSQTAGISQNEGMSHALHSPIMIDTYSGSHGKSFCTRGQLVTFSVTR